MPAVESRTSIPTLDSRPSLGGVATGLDSSILPGHDVTAGQPEGLRNPVMRALQQVGQFLARKITAIRPQFGRADRAAASTRLQLRTVLEHLAVGRAQRRRPDRRHPQARGSRAPVGTGEPGGPPGAPQSADPQRVPAGNRGDRVSAFEPQQRQSLLKALISPQFLSAQDMLQGAGDEDTERSLVHLAAAVTRDEDTERALVHLAAAVTSAVADREFATIGLKFDTSLAMVRGHALSSGITAAADKAVTAARETVQQLRRDGLRWFAAGHATGAGTLGGRGRPRTNRVDPASVPGGAPHPE